jgi:hypothetical protein
MGISPDLWRKSYRGHRPSLRTPIGALVLCGGLAVLIVGSGLSAMSAPAATVSASSLARKWSLTSATPTSTRSSNTTTPTFPTSASATYNGYDDPGFYGQGGDITAVFTPIYAQCAPALTTECDYRISGVSGTLFGDTAPGDNPSVPCSVTITPTLEQYILSAYGGSSGLALTTRFGGQSEDGSGGGIILSMYDHVSDPCEAGIDVDASGGFVVGNGSALEPWSPGTKTSTWPLGNGATGSVHINWTSNVAPVWAVPTPAEAPVCHGTSGSAAHTALAVVSSGTQCSPETTVTESTFAQQDAEVDGWLCHSNPNVAGLPVTETSPIAWFCHLRDLIATSDYKAWAEGSAAGAQLPPPKARDFQARVQNAPPTTNFGAVFQPKPFTVPTLGTCPRPRGASCRRLRTAWVQYLDALANVASVSEAVGVTAERFGGAKDAGDLSAERLQSVAETKYLPLQASAIRGLQQAGRRLGSVLRSDHLNAAVTAKQVAQGREQLRKLDGIPGSLIARLERDGLITNRKDLERIIASLLKKAPRARATTLAQVLGM